MFIEGFDPVARLAESKCPRCHTVGLVVVDAETYANTTEADRHDETVYICPSITARCPACGLVGNWPGMCRDPEAKPRRKRQGLPEKA